MSVPARIRSCRQRMGLTQEELAEDLGVSARTVQAWEAGTRNPGLQSQRKLARVFDRPIEQFRARRR